MAEVLPPYQSTQRKKERLYHIKIPVSHWGLTHPGWHEMTEEKRKDILERTLALLQEGLKADRIIYSGYTEDHPELTGPDKGALKKIRLFIKRVMWLFHPRTPFGVHIVKIKT